MNERIKELIEQATSTQGPTPYNPLTFEVFDKEKFAELIVRECMAVARKADGLDAEYEAWYLIEQHFGVEE